MDEITAYHEAGHALMALLLGERVQSISIEPDWDDGPRRSGEVQIAFTTSDSSRDTILRSIQIALAGPVAEMIHSGEPFHPGLVEEWSADWSAAWDAAAAILPQETSRLRFLEQSTVQIYRLLRDDKHWAALAAIVDHLLAHETLESDEVHEIVRYWMR